MTPSIKIYSLAILFIYSLASQAATIIVSGANSGLGQSIVQTLAQENHDLILFGRDSSKLESTKNQLKRAGHKSSIYAFSNEHISEIHRTMQELADQKTSIAGLVIITPRPDLDDPFLPSPQAWHAMFESCFTGPLEIIKQTASMIEENGKIVIISGITSKELLPSHASYGILRAMWLAQAKGLSHHLGAKKIHVNTISPGGILTEKFIEKVKLRAKENENTYQRQIESETQNIPLQKYGNPQDVAYLVSFLLSEKSNHISGANITIDGGFTRAY